MVQGAEGSTGAAGGRADRIAADLEARRARSRKQRHQAGRSHSRAATLSGATTSPPIFEVMQVLGREETLGRMDDAIGAGGG
jgi:glutamyl-tRNA synthetase